MFAKIFSGSSQTVMKLISVELQKLSLNIIMEPQNMDKQQNQQSRAEYSQQNEELRKAYLERQERQRQNSLNQVAPVDDRKWKLQEKTSPLGSPLVEHMLLNHLIYDRRKPKPAHYVSLNALFNEKPNERNIGFDYNHSIESIFMSTFGFESELLEPIANIGCPFILSNDRSGEEATQRKYNGYPNWTVVFPVKKTKGYSVYHSKLWLIKFKTFLRVVVGTGNLHLADWAVWANAFWWKDFPPIDKKKQQEEKGKKPSDSLAEDFKTTLKLAIKFMLPEDFGAKELNFDLDDYDYSEVDVILIPSVPGTFADEGEFGLSKVKKYLLKYGSIESSKREILTCNTTSLGVVQQDFLKDLYKCFNPHSHKDPVLSDIKLIYPTGRYIRDQTVGAAETLFLTEANYQRSPVLRNVLHRYEDNPLNPSNGNIPHLKTIILSSQLDQNVTFYIGSHNLTKAAWGNKKTTRTGDKYSYNNTELGLLFPNYNYRKLQHWLPFKFPPTRYEPGEQPFFRA